MFFNYVSRLWVCPLPRGAKGTGTFGYTIRLRQGLSITILERPKIFDDREFFQIVRRVLLFLPNDDENREFELFELGII